MSKRNRKKLKRMMRSSLEQNQTVQASSTTGQNQVPAGKSQNLSQNQINNELEIEDEREVKTEIRKILITVLVLILIVVAIYFINIKTDLILKMGKFVADKLNLSI